MPRHEVAMVATVKTGAVCVGNHDLYARLLRSRIDPRVRSTPLLLPPLSPLTSVHLPIHNFIASLGETCLELFQFFFLYLA